MARPDPRPALIVLIPCSSRKVRRQQHARLRRIPSKRVKARLDLRLARMRPDRARDEIVETRPEHRRIEPGVFVEPGPLPRALLGRDEVPQPILDASPRGLDPAVASRLEKANQPVGDPKASAADLDDARLRTQAGA